MLIKDANTSVNEFKTELILQEKNLDIPISPNNKKYWLATLFGFLLSSFYVTDKYLIRK